MPTRCCVPGCSEYGGHKFPTDPDLCLRWRVAIKRSSSKKGLWKPGKHDVVCHQHFKASDYKETLLGNAMHFIKDIKVNERFILTFYVDFNNKHCP